jgi:hypothetical protein
MTTSRNGDEPTIKWFGTTWGAPLCSQCPEIPVPVGLQCVHCDDAFTHEDSGVQYANGPLAHLNCFLRGTYGSVAHIEKRCGCYVEGSTEGDPEGMTKRQAADAAVEAYEKMQRRRIQ